MKQNDLSTLRVLIASKADVNAINANGTTALHYAVERQSERLVKELLLAGASREKKNVRSSSVRIDDTRISRGSDSTEASRHWTSRET